MWLMVFGAILAYLMLAFTPPAHSAPPNTDQQAFEYWSHYGSRVCADLDRDATVDGLVIAALDIFNHSGLNSAQTGQVIGLSIHFTCPKHQNLIDQYRASRTRGVIA